MPLGSDITSWHFQDLNWEDPNPLDARYMQAICNGLIERKQKILASHGLYDYPDGIIPAVLSKPYYENGGTGLLFSQSDLAAIYAQAVNLFPYFACTFADGIADRMRLSFTYSTLGGSSIEPITGCEDLRTVSTNGYGTTLSFLVSVIEGEVEIKYRARYNPWSTDPTTTVSRHILRLNLPSVEYEKRGDLSRQFSFSAESWTEKTMMAYIGAEKIEAACSPINAGAWMKQMYKIINALTVYGTSINNSSYFTTGYAEEKFARRAFIGVGEYGPYLWSSTWGIGNSGTINGAPYPSGSNTPPPDTPPVETVWGNGTYQVWDMSTAHYFAKCLRQKSTDGNGAEYLDYADRYRAMFTVGLSSSGIMAGARIDIHIEALQLVKEPFYTYNYVDGQYVATDKAEFNSEMGAENSFLTFNKSGISGESENFPVGDFEDVPAEGAMQVGDLNGGYAWSNKNWVIRADYQFFKDFEFGLETSWTKATVNVSQDWNFKAD